MPRDPQDPQRPHDQDAPVAPYSRDELPDDVAAELGTKALSDGDGPRSDQGTNPLPEMYWAAYLYTFDFHHHDD